MSDKPTDGIQINVTSEDLESQRSNSTGSNVAGSQSASVTLPLSSNAKLQQLAQQLRSQRSAKIGNISSTTGTANPVTKSNYGLPSRGPTSANQLNPLLVGTFPAMDSPQRMDAPGGGPRRQKTRLEPGHSAMDWETLKKSNGSNTKMRGGIDPSSFPLRISKDELKKHNTKDNCWVSLGSKVYDITMYLKFHPGGDEILIKSSGRDATALFNKYHRWVNFERILDGCLVGFLV